jgi:hypothetical protein
MEPTNENAVHRPGVVSLLFVHKAALFAAGFWAWLIVLAVLGGPATAWTAVAAAGAITTTLVAVVLGARFALQRNAAARHEQMMRVLVDMSWHSFAQAARDKSFVDDPRESSVIPLSPESRRPRR